MRGSPLLIDKRPATDLGTLSAHLLPICRSSTVVLAPCMRGRAGKCSFALELLPRSPLHASASGARCSGSVGGLLYVATGPSIRHWLGGCSVMLHGDRGRRVVGRGFGRGLGLCIYSLASPWVEWNSLFLVTSQSSRYPDTPIPLPTNNNTLWQS
jgi:hypothetical protein